MTPTFLDSSSDGSDTAKNGSPSEASVTVSPSCWTCQETPRPNSVGPIT